MFKHCVFLRGAAVAVCLAGAAALYGQSPIDLKYGQLGGNSGLLGPIAGPEVSTLDRVGRWREYQNGVIYWLAATGAHEVHGAILAKWTALNRERGFLGYPTTDERVAADNLGRYQDFQGGSIFWSAATGAFELHGKIREKYLLLGNVKSSLGYPKSDEKATPDGVGRFNEFQTGSIYWTPTTGAYEVHGQIAARWAQLGYERSYLGYPVSDERPIPGYSGFGRYNRFQYGSIYYTATNGVMDLLDPTRQWGSLNLIPFKGTVPVLAILWDPKRPTDPAPPASTIDAMLFGNTNSVADWFRENTQGAVTIQKVPSGTSGWYPARNPDPNYYWTKQASDTDGNGFVSGFVEKWTEAIADADPYVNFAAYDRNRDGKLDGTELTVLIVIPSNSVGGYQVQPVGRQVPYADLVVDGVKIALIVEWYTGAPPLMGYAAHEIAHMIFNAPDEYQTSYWPFAPSVYSIMDNSSRPGHFDPAVKLKAQVANYQFAAGTGEYVLKPVETSNDILILADTRRRDEGNRLREYFILENRWRGTSYDAQALPMDGLGLWRVIDDPNLLPLVKAPTGLPNEWGRQGIQLFRADGGAGNLDADALLAPGQVISDTTPNSKLFWADGSATGFTITVIGYQGQDLRIRIDR